MPSVEGHIVCSHTDFVTSFLYFDTKSWTEIDSCDLIVSMVNLNRYVYYDFFDFKIWKGDSDADFDILNYYHKKE